MVRGSYTANGVVKGIQGTGKGCGSSADGVMGRVIEMVLRTAAGVIERGKRDSGYRKRLLLFLGQVNKDEGYQQRVWFFWGWGNRVWSD